MVYMGIENVAASLLEESRNEAGRIIRDADQAVNQMASGEQARRVVLLKHAEEEAHVLIEEERRERIAWARLEAKRILNEAKEDMIREKLDEFFALLGNVRKEPKYKEFLKGALQRATDELKGQPGGIIVYCAKEDKAALADTNAKIVPTLDTFGGIIAESNDRTVRIDLTLETLFENKRDELRALIYREIFEKKAAEDIPPKKVKK